MIAAPVLVPEQEQRNARASRWPRVAPYLLAVCFALLALRSSGDFFYNDSPKHAMNGAFMCDMIRHGKFLHPVQYAKEYYSRLPGLSMPYHPPLFPVVEGLFFLIFGVSFWGVRLLMAAIIAACVVMMYRLLANTLRSSGVAACVVAAFFASRFSTELSSEPMLEFPVLLLALAALYQLRDLEHGYPLRRGLAFALLAGAAVWTKQQAVFLGAVPFAYVVFSGRWRLLLGKAIWISSALFAAPVAGLLAISAAFHGAGGTSSVPPPNQAWLMHHVQYYFRAFRGIIGLPVFIAVAIAALGAIFAWRWRSKNLALNLYLAWAGSAALVLLMLGVFDGRYLFLLYPPLLAIAYAGMWHVCGKLFGWRRAWYVPAAVALYLFIAGCMAKPPYVSGLSSVAASLVNGTPRRILYCGAGAGNFVFAARAADPGLNTIILRGDRIATSFAPDAIESLAHRYGVQAIVLSEEPISRKWDRLRTSPAPSMVLEKRVAVISSGRGWDQARLHLYRFTNPSPNPARALKVYIPKLDSDLELTF